MSIATTCSSAVRGQQVTERGGGAHFHGRAAALAETDCNPAGATAVNSVTAVVENPLQKCPFMPLPGHMHAQGGSAFPAQLR